MSKNIIYLLYSYTICVSFIGSSESGANPTTQTSSSSASTSSLLPSSSSSSLSSASGSPLLSALALVSSSASLPLMSATSAAAAVATAPSSSPPLISFNNEQQQQQQQKQQQQSLMDLDSTLLKNLLNISNNPPELIEYYELDDDIPTSTFQSIFEYDGNGNNKNNMFNTKIPSLSSSSSVAATTTSQATIATIMPSITATGLETTGILTSSSSSASSVSSSSSSTLSVSMLNKKSPTTKSSSTTILAAQTTLPDIYPDPEEVNRKIKVLNINHIPHKSGIYESRIEESLLDSIPISSSSSSAAASHNGLIDYSSRDNDFKGHDLIDNIMYIYYGSQKSIRNGIGSSIVIGGSVLALAAQILCLILMILRNRRLRRHNALFSIFFNFVFTLLLANLIFVLGVQATRSEFRCGVIAILLHYFHLSTTIWGLIYIYIIYDYIVNDCGINLKYNYFMAYGAPAVYVLFSCAISASSYETVEFCWMSVHRGMIVNFMIPISGIILASTVLGTLCLREIAAKQREVIAESIENILENAAKCHEINNAATVIETDKCCEIEEREVCKKTDFYDSKFDLGVLSIVDLSLQSSADAQDFSDFKRSIKFWLFFQPAFALCWFFGTMAMENRQTYIMPIIFIISCNIMNWYLLVRSPYICPIIQDQHQKEKFTSNDTNEELQPHAPGTDTIPLLCTPNSKLQNPKISNIIEDSMNEQINNLTVNWGDSLGDISINLDSISTISS